MIAVAGPNNLHYVSIKKFHTHLGMDQDTLSAVPWLETAFAAGKFVGDVSSTWKSVLYQHPTMQAP